MNVKITTKEIQKQNVLNAKPPTVRLNVFANLAGQEMIVPQKIKEVMDLSKPWFFYW